jgi:hypothetical protein
MINVPRTQEVDARSMQSTEKHSNSMNSREICTPLCPQINA